MLIGLPLTSHNDMMDFRVFVNKQLNQHVHVAVPEIPKWVPANEHSGGVEPALSAALITLPSSETNLGLVLLVIRPNNSAALMSMNGGFFHVGCAESESVKDGCIVLVNFSRGPCDAFMGGTLTVMDVFSFDGKNYSEIDYLERAKFFRFVHKAISLPSRYKLVASTAIKPSQTKSFNETVACYVLLKNESS